MMITNTANVTFEDVKGAETNELLIVYNEITKKNIKKFTNRTAAENQTWKAIQSLPPGEDALSDTAPDMQKREINKARKLAKLDGKRHDYENRIIKLLVTENPKRKTSRAYKKFGILMEMDGQTVGEYRAKEGKYPTLDQEAGWPSTEIRWALSLGLIKLIDQKKEASKAA